MSRLLASASALAAALLVAALAVRRRRRALPRQTPHPPSSAKHVPRVSTHDAAAAAVRTEGVCIVERALDAAFVADLRARLATIEPRKMQNRRKHRWEHVHSPEAPPFVELAELPAIAALVRALLGPKTYLEKAGLLVSHPGAEAQRWHMDTPHLFSVGTHLPPHCAPPPIERRTCVTARSALTAHRHSNGAAISVFVPLVELVPSNGPTEFQLGTHVKANLVAPQRHATACCEAGSLVVYDVRIMHRGGPNASDAERPLVYMTFSRVWYRDTLNP